MSWNPFSGDAVPQDIDSAPSTESTIPELWDMGYISPNASFDDFDDE